MDKKISRRKFYRTKVTVDVLTEGPLSSEIELDELHYVITEGDGSGVVTVGESKQLNAKQAARLLGCHGSDPEFFRLTEKGEDIDD